MDEDGEITDMEKSEESAIESKPHFSKDKLVLYHWTQSFTSQKVKHRHHENEMEVSLSYMSYLL